MGKYFRSEIKASPKVEEAISKMPLVFGNEKIIQISKDYTDILNLRSIVAREEEIKSNLLKVSTSIKKKRNKIKKKEEESLYAISQLSPETPK